MTASVVIKSAAIDAAFCKAERVTFTGSMMPALIMSTYSPVAALELDLQQPRSPEHLCDICCQLKHNHGPCLGQLLHNLSLRKLGHDQLQQVELRAEDAGRLLRFGEADGGGRRAVHLDGTAVTGAEVEVVEVPAALRYGFHTLLKNRSRQAP